MADLNVAVDITQQVVQVDVESSDVHVTTNNQVVEVSVEQGPQTAVVQQTKVQQVTVYKTGPQGAPGQAQNTFTFEQLTPTSIWTIDHNLGFWPKVSIYDTSGREAEGSITNPSLSRTTITFSAAFAGKARLS